MTKSNNAPYLKMKADLSELSCYIPLEYIFLRSTLPDQTGGQFSYE